MAKLPLAPRDDVADKQAKVSAVINQLNLQRCADTFMGNRLIRGVSGGEMKRTAVACALLCSPKCMFLDEPTSGLDSAMAREVVLNLRALRDEQGCTFVVTIHQPAPAVFDAFERLVLLNYGRVAYWGPGRGAPLDFFAAQGFPYRPGFNVAEYLIDTLNSHSVATGGSHDFEGFYAASALREANVASVERRGRASASRARGARRVGARRSSKFANGAARELWVLLRYKGLSRVKHPLFVTTRVFLYVLLAGLLSSFFYGQDRQLTGIFNSVGILFISVILPCFMAQVFVEEMKFDREVYTREFNDAATARGTTSRTASWWRCPRWSSPRYRSPPSCTRSVGLNASTSAFAFFVLAAVVNFAIAMLVGFTIAAGIRGEVGPAVFLPVFTTLNMLVGGFFIRKVTIHAVWIWLYWISFIQWTWSALMANEFGGAEFFDHCDAESVADLFGAMPLSPSQERALSLYAASRSGQPCEPILGDTVLASFELDHRDKWLSLGYAACSLPVFVLTFYLGVRHVKHERR